MGKLYITLAKSLNGEVGFVVSDHPETGKEIHESIDTESYGMKTFEIEKETLYSIDMDDNDLLKIFKNIEEIEGEETEFIDSEKVKRTNTP